MSAQSKRPCKWKQPITPKSSEKTEISKFPCRFPDQELTTELCTQCLLGDLFTLQYTQFISLRQGFNFQQEMMAYLKNMTGDGSLDDLK